MGIGFIQDKASAGTCTALPEIPLIQQNTMETSPRKLPCSKGAGDTTANDSNITSNVRGQRRICPEQSISNEPKGMPRFKIQSDTQKQAENDGLVAYLTLINGGKDLRMKQNSVIQSRFS